MNARQWTISIASLGAAALFLLIALALFISMPGIEMLLIAGILVLCAVLMVAQAGKPVRAEMAKQTQRRNRR
jgi:flagellar biosynthesis component FlhA